MILVLIFGCQNKENIDGNYSICQDGEYLEVYFKKDSMRAASDDSWTKLSEWRKIEIKNDTLLFETFGEWRMASKAKIKFLRKNEINLLLLRSGQSINLKPIYGTLNFEKSKEFWDGFYKRQNSKNCK